MSEHASWEARLGRMKSAVELWAKRTSGDDSGPARVEPGSSLSGDDKLFPDHPVSSVAWHGLITAVEHLDFALTAMAKTQTLYPAAYFTTLRAGLLGAAQAVWVLDPRRRTERQTRALAAAAANYAEQRKAIGALSPTTPEQATELSALRDRLSNRLDEVAAAAESIGCDPARARKLSLVATDVIKKAASAALAGTPEQEYAMYLWRIGSGHVHGHPYTRYLQLRTDDLTKDADGRLWGRNTATITEVGLAASAAVDRRSAKPSTPSGSTPSS
ncbi:hypothetical protein PV410_24775 [Streptomyces sp. PA03-5A]|nr:hypothetical protein [Streptomyces sp. PA03-5A]